MLNQYHTICNNHIRECLVGLSFLHAFLNLLSLYNSSMKFQPMDLPFGKNQTPQKTSKIVILIALALVLLTIVPLYYPLLRYTSKNIISEPPSSYDPADQDSIEIENNEKCDIFTGEWVPNPSAPYYVNTTCWAIHEHQNCMKYGRPDTDFMKWKWKPDGCDLPVFNPFQFLEIVRGKSLAFVGDSVGRNQMQSMICLLSRVEYPIDVSYTADEHFKRWRYTSYNFTVAYFWTPYLVKTSEEDADGPTHTGLFNLHLDEYDEDWTSQVEEFDYLILSAGHWFYRPSMYYEKRRLVGCRYCQIENVTDLPMYYGYRRAFRTAFRAINSMENFKGITFLRTFAPSHFENGLWDEGGDCVRKRPLRSNESVLEDVNLEMYMTQVEEFRAAEREGRKRGLRFRLLDTTQAMLLRPDGHPSRYGHWPNQNVTMPNDCVHWCLPGPIDTWSDFLLHMLKLEGRRSFQQKMHLKQRKQRMI
ncbi:protein trichome birefringence-like 19 [Cornus florida]|uniref:protein trichome birefringence-like 19 n=1 Tax=Cornus florida TaxID=4283 RepID=UPI00289EF3F3|nr:protein trichome birefringence-like 19 [Cornus florida]